MTYTHHEETIDGLTVRIMLDEDGFCCNPRDNFRGTTMVLEHRRYNLPMEVDFDAEAFDFDMEAIEAFIREEYRAVAFAWVRGYDRGPFLSLSDGYPFSDPWDSGVAGFMFVTKAQQDEMGTPDDLLREVMAGELEEYDRWANGEVYGFVVETPEGYELDSCWGFIGDDYVLDEARDVARHLAAGIAEAIATEDAEAALPIVAGL